MEYVQQNAHIWDKRAENNDIWSQPVSSEVIDAARNGTWSIVLTLDDASLASATAGGLKQFDSCGNKETDI